MPTHPETLKLTSGSSADATNLECQICLNTILITLALDDFRLGALPLVQLRKAISQTMHFPDDVLLLLADKPELLMIAEP